MPSPKSNSVQKSRARSVASAAYPFSAIVGQEEIKLALILNVIDLSIGGVLMMGHRGTGKSTAVRAVATLLPAITISKNCAFNCEPIDLANLCPDCSGTFATGKKIPTEQISVPVVDLPLGATEDRVCGSIDIQRALRDGTKSFEPGLLARSNRGFLYIDEVNLLEDHLVDLLLDVAVTGRNKVERENISIEHAARFVLIGSGNPEEGELRPQLLDRFGLYVEVKTENDPERRVEIVTRRDAFEKEQLAFCSSFAADERALRQRIARAKRNLATVEVPPRLLMQIATMCSDLKIDGHRGELTIMRAARALAAFNGRKSVKAEDVRRVALFSLRHRINREGSSDSGAEARIEQALNRALPPEAGNTSEKQRKEAHAGGPDRSQSGSSDHNGRQSADSSKIVPAGLSINSDLSSLKANDRPPTRARNKNRTRSSNDGGTAYNSRSGRYIKARIQHSIGARIALDATLRAFLAAGLRSHPDQENNFSGALRFKQFARKQGTLFIFAIDTSGSMALNRIRKAKGAALKLLKESYVNRDRVAIVVFRETGAQLMLPPSRSIIRARRVLDSLSVGGATPLSAGLACSLAVAERAAPQGDSRLVLLVFTDGGSNVPLQALNGNDRIARQRIIENECSQLGSRLTAARVETVVVDTQDSFISESRAQTLAQLIGARHMKLESETVRS